MRARGTRRGLVWPSRVKRVSSARSSSVSLMRYGVRLVGLLPPYDRSAYAAEAPGSLVIANPASSP